MRHTTINYIFALLALALGFTSCSRETGLKMEEGAGNSVRFTIESGLRAVGDENTTRPTPALDREKKIESLYAVVYKTSSGLHYKTVKCTDLTGGKYEFDNEKSGDFYFFLVANPDQELVKKLEAGPTTPEDLGMLVATQTPGENNQAEKFLMTSERKNVKVKSKVSTDLGPIKLVRVAARFDIYNTIDGLKITKVTFGKRRVQSHLFAQVGKMDGLTATENEKTYDGNLFESNVLKATIYGYETDTRNETFFTIEATYKGKPLNPETVRLENFVIKRNHLYNIILHDVGGAHDPADPKKKFGQFEYTIKVVDWNEGEAATYPEDDILKPFYVDYKAEISNAPYMSPYLVNSPEEIYTTTKEASELTITVGGYMEPGTLQIAVGFNNKIGATLTEADPKVTTDPNTGKIFHHYKLSIPKMDDYISLVKDGSAVTPTFLEIPLEAKNYSGATVKKFAIKHGRIKMPLEYVSEKFLAPHTDGQAFAFATDETQVANVGFFHMPSFVEKNTHKLTVNGEGYHLPDNCYELCSLFPYSNDRSTGLSEYSVGEDALAVDNAAEWMTMPCWAYIKGKRSYYIKPTSDYRTDKTKRVSYGLRFKNAPNGFGNTLVMAYRYEWAGDFKKETTGKVSSYYTVTSRYLGSNWNGGVDGIANEEFWNKNKENDISRKFYALGGIINYGSDPGTRYFYVGLYSLIPTPVFVADSDGDKKGYVQVARLSNKECLANTKFQSNISNLKPEENIMYPVRLFSDK